MLFLKHRLFPCMETAEVFTGESQTAKTVLIIQPLYHNGQMIKSTNRCRYAGEAWLCSSTRKHYLMSLYTYIQKIIVSLSLSSNVIVISSGHKCKFSASLNSLPY